MTGIILARILHVGLGVFWVGAVLFNALFLTPAMLDAGPDAAKVGAALARRGFMRILPWVAVITLISGFWLYWKVSFGFHPDYMGSAHGIVYGTGGLCAVIAYAIGMTIMRPAMMKAMALGPAIAAASEAERPVLMAQAAALRLRGFRASQIVSLFLVVTTVCMAIGRYVG